jgi:hypothetical protein
MKDIEKGIEYAVGAGEPTNAPLPPYDGETCAFIAELSARLMRSAAARRFSDIAALAFWCRKANIAKLKAAFGEAPDCLGRGLCFHVAPSNVPVNFAFSWLFALLAGNSSIVRLPSAAFPQIGIVCDAVGETLAKYPAMRERAAFVRYPADNGAVTAELSKIADARMIWGGDDTIAAIRALPAKPRCVDLAFADRYSFCVINAQAVLAAGEDRIAELAENFFNDTYLMDQNACSSPRLIAWANDSEKARERFWGAVELCASTRYRLQASVAVEKYTRMCEDALDRERIAAVARAGGNLLYRAELKALRPDAENFRGRCGYFYEYSLRDVAEIAAAVTDKYQTLTQFGMDSRELRAFVIENRLRGIDRIVPVGKAMDIGVVWDGFDIVRMLSRTVDAL